jgi:hypothetical protein
MNMTDITLVMDVAAELPTADDLNKYGIATMAVRRNSPGGGWPEGTVTFTGDGVTPRQNAIAFLAEYYGSQEPDEDLELHAVAAA